MGKEQGKTAIRYSKKRSAILELLQSTTTHPSAEWLFQQLKPEYPNLSLGTIYRNLIFFQEQGEVISVGVVNGQERFDATTETHSHFICDDCGCVVDLHHLKMDEVLGKKVTEKCGLEVDRFDLKVYGRCADCQASDASVE